MVSVGHNIMYTHTMYLDTKSRSNNFSSFSAASMVDFGLNFKSIIHLIIDQRQQSEIMERCKLCLIEAAAQVILYKIKFL